MGACSSGELEGDTQTTRSVTDGEAGTENAEATRLLRLEQSKQTRQCGRKCVRLLHDKKGNPSLLVIKKKMWHGMYLLTSHNSSIQSKHICSFRRGDDPQRWADCFQRWALEQNVPVTDLKSGDHIFRDSGRSERNAKEKQLRKARAALALEVADRAQDAPPDYKSWSYTTDRAHSNRRLSEAQTAVATLERQLSPAVFVSERQVVHQTPNGSGVSQVATQSFEEWSTGQLGPVKRCIYGVSSRELLMIDTFHGGPGSADTSSYLREPFFSNLQKL